MRIWPARTVSFVFSTAVLVSARVWAAGGAPSLPADRYLLIDAYARALPEAEAADLPHLAAALARAARTDEEKARATFTWIATHIRYDVDYLRGGGTRAYDAAAVLRTRAAICQGYADLFTALATAMHLPAHTVVGQARRGLPRVDSGHAWNAYQAGGRWHLLDATWGAGYVDAALRFSFVFKPWYFDPAPGALIFSHVPDEATWQLLDTPATPAEIAAWPDEIPGLLFARGVSGAALRRALARRRTAGVAELPAVYDCPLAAQLEQVPLHAELEPGRPVIFRLAIDSNTVAGIDNGGRVQILRRVGAGWCEATLLPRPGQLRVLLWPRKQRYGTRHVLLDYRVAGPLPVLERRRRWPDSVNVAYLIRYRARWVAPPAKG